MADIGMLPVVERPHFDPNVGIEDVTRFAIDQVIVDGEVDGADRRAPLKMLTRIAFEGLRAPADTLADFRDALTDDERHVDVVDRRYGYEPVLPADSTVRATPAAIIRERGMYTEEEREAVMGLMEACATAIYQNLHAGSRVVPLRVATGALNSGGIRLSYDEFGGLLAYMRRDDARLKILRDGRVALAENTGDRAEPDTLPRVSDFSSLISEALPRVVTDRTGAFRLGTMLGTLKAMGTYVRPDEVSALREQLLSHSGVVALDGGNFKINGTKERPARQSSAALDKMIHEAFGGSSGGSKHKPHNRRGRGGWRRYEDTSDLR